MRDSNKCFGLELRLLLAIIASIIIIVVDTKFNVLIKLKNYIENSVYFFNYLCNQPNFLLNYAVNIFKGYKKLILENDKLRQELFFKNSELLLLEQYKKDNLKLRALLNLPYCLNEKRIVVGELLIRTDLYNHHIIINLGTSHDIYIGQPVITNEGLVGQVISVNQYTSRILLICDPMHSLSVQVKRNDIRMILTGHGYNKPLYAEYASGHLDIQIGDMLVTSGLDDRFPTGYPVAEVIQTIFDLKKDVTTIVARPIVNLQCLRYVILLWK